MIAVLIGALAVTLTSGALAVRETQINHRAQATEPAPAGTTEGELS